MRRFWIQSDQHLELTYDGWDLPAPEERPSFDVMIVAGDLIPRAERGVKWLAERVPDRPVLYVPGNHEGYNADIDRTIEKAREAALGTNVTLMNNDAVEIGGTLFVGATLWTNFALFGDRDYAMMRARESMNDYSRIRTDGYTRRLRPADTLARHHVSCEFIARSLRESIARRRVVITHHGPVRQAVRRGSEEHILSAAYVSDRPDLLAGVDLWVYGHTHERRDFIVSKTRLISNAKGYGPRDRGGTCQNLDFDPNLVVEI